MICSLSIIIPFFNSQQTLERAIRSVVSQHFFNWELILINDGSTDQSEKIAESFLIDPKVSYFKTDNKGVSAARNFGSSKAKGDWLIFLDSDDEFRYEFLSQVELELSRGSDFDYLVYGINRINNRKETKKIPKDGEYFSKIPGTFVIRKSLFDQEKGYDERFKFSENTELFHRLGLIGAKGKNIQWVSLNYYDNPVGGSKNLKNIVDSLSLFLEIHKDTLTPHVKHLYTQIIGVNLLRFGEFVNAKVFFWRSIQNKPFAFKTWVRYFISWIPALSKKLYPIVQ